MLLSRIHQLINRLKLSLSRNRFQWLTVSQLMDDQSWWEIYYDAFPPEERDSKAEILSAVEKKLALVGKFKLSNVEVAIVVIYLINQPKFTLLHYFAIHKQWRQQKIGTNLFISLLKEIKRIGYPCLVWEVDDPDYAQNQKDFVLQNKRMKFYVNLGGKIIDRKYFQPGLQGLPPVHMKLMYHSNQAVMPEKEIAEAIYLEKYAKVNNISKKILMNLLEKF